MMNYDNLYKTDGTIEEQVIRQRCCMIYLEDKVSMLLSAEKHRQERKENWQTSLKILSYIIIGFLAFNGLGQILNATILNK